jgi:ketosteroid isomerase-like protein
MRFLILPLFSALAMSASAADSAGVPAYIGRHTTTPEDQREIRQVVADFQAALKTKNIHLLASLMLHSDIEFVSPAPPEALRKIRESYDPNASPLRAGGFRDFARFIRESKVPVEERFHNLKITQDKHLAWLMFDYEFVEDGKVWNYGIETWQMTKNLEGKWKIANVWWSTNLMQ